MMTDFKRPSTVAISPAHVGAIPLSALTAGEHGIVVELAGGEGLQSRMVPLGFTPGADILVLQNFGRGPLIARVRSARIALGRGEANKILVRKELG
ncbi:MAG: ferrous iron transport protein A [Anaerolineae bacterium]|nr:ferrous iron transport protein A [Anaerolineae bacterium]